jgi:hypothetical protein
MSYLVAIMSSTPTGERLQSYKDMCEAVIGAKKTKMAVLPFLYAGAIGLNIGRYSTVLGKARLAAFNSIWL